MTRFDGRGLVLPGRGPSPLPALRARYLGLAVRAFTRLGPRLPPALRPLHSRLCAMVKDGLSRAPEGVLDAFASPAVCASLHCELAGYGQSEFRERVQAGIELAVTQVAAELAARGLGPAGGQAPVRPAEERETPRVTGFAALVIDDHNPIALLEAHPEKGGNAPSLGGRSARDWTRALQESMSLIEQALPRLHAEMRLLLRHIVPVGYDPQRHFSASYKEAVGTIYLSLHPDALTMAEATIHEFQHNKLYLACHTDPLLHNALSPLYPSPVRPDPRPLWGVLLAVHAFLPVAVFGRRLRELGHPAARPPSFTRHLAEIDLKNDEGVQVLAAHGDWTPAGRSLFQELQDLNAAHLAQSRLSGTAAAAIQGARDVR